ncbi:UvsW, partial [bacterium]|nr:UvsW [bacterium]
FDYSIQDKSWSCKKYIHKISAGQDKETNKQIVVSTWQSIYKLPKEWFGQFDVLIGDEAHTFKAKSLTSIMEKLVNTKIKIGTTGTLDNSKINILVLQGIFGPAHRVTTTKALMDNKKLAELKITSLILKYDEELRKNFKNMTYQQEMDLLVSNEKRNKFIRNLTLKCTGNTLLLFQYVEKHGKILHELITEKADENRKVFFIHGGTHVSDREAIRKIVAQESDAIIIASFGVYSAGIDVPSIENVIFASPSKSKIRNLQSIGRGLRLKDGKTHCNLYDIADDLSYKSWKNHTLKHAAERYKLYTEEQFKIQLIEVPL